jgi:hypothetical protein
VSLPLFDNVADLIRAGIEANRAEAASIVPAVLRGEQDAKDRMIQLNDAWADLETALYAATGVDFAPYRIGRRK